MFFRVCTYTCEAVSPLILSHVIADVPSGCFLG